MRPFRLIRSAFLTVALWSAVSLAVVAAHAEDVKTPVIKVEVKSHDLGEVYEAKSYKYTFKVKNVGDADLKIDRVKPG